MGELEAKKTSRRRIVAIVVLWTAVMAAVCVMAGCYGHNCDGDTVAYGRNTGEGRLLDADTWESSAIDGDWISFSKQRIWIFQMKELGERTPFEIIPYISAEQNPNRDGNWTLGSGNIVEQSQVGPGQIVLKNNTCADYFIRVVVHVPPRPQDPTPPLADASIGARP